MNKALFFHSKRYQKTLCILPDNYITICVPSFGRMSSRLLNYFVLLLKTKDQNLLITDVNGLPLFYFCLIGFILRKKIILRYRGDFFAENKNKRITNFIQKFSLKRVSIIICVSQYLKEQLINNSISKTKIIVINTPVKNLTPVACSNVKTTFLFVTNFHFEEKVKELSLYIKTISKFISEKKLNYRIVIVGGGAFLTKLIDEMEQFDNILFTGKIDRQELDMIYNESKLFFHISHLDAFPSVIQEAMSYGIPILTNKFGGMTEMIEHNINGFFVDNPSNAIYYIKRILANELLHSSIHHNNLRKQKLWSNEKLKIDMTNALNKIN